MATSSMSGPVTAATKFIIQLNAKQPCTKDEGTKLCSQLVDWIKDPSHPDYHEAATLPFFLARKLLRRELINQRDYKAICKSAAEAIQQAKIDHVLGEFLRSRGYEVTANNTEEAMMSPHEEVCKQWAAFLKDTQATRDQGLNLFERLIQWLSVCDENDPSYDGSTITIFSMALDLEEKKSISPEEKAVLFNRAFQVVVKDPKHTIRNKDLIEFLRQRGFKIR